MLRIKSSFWLLWVLVGFVGQAHARVLLPEGIYLKAIDGHVVRDQTTGLWRFQMQDDVKINNVNLTKETHLVLLPNDHLQALIADVAKHPDITYRLWAKVTEYKGENYLFILNYLLLTQTQTDNTSRSKDASETPAADASTGRLEIPESVRRTLSQQRGVQPGSRVSTQNDKSSHVLLNRVGYVGSGDNNKMFIFDGFSLTIHEPAIRLLPSRALEQMEREQSRSPGPHRFNIVGITSTFEGKPYLLVQRAFRIYSYGNFVP